MHVGFLDGSISEGWDRYKAQSVVGCKFYAGCGVGRVELACRFSGFIWSHPVSRYLKNPPCFEHYIRHRVDSEGPGLGPLVGKHTEPCMSPPPGEPLDDFKASVWVYDNRKYSPGVYCVPRKPMDVSAHTENIEFLVDEIDQFSVQRVQVENTIDERLGRHKAQIDMLSDYCEHFNVPLPEHREVNELIMRANARKTTLKIKHGGKWNACT